MSSFHRRPHAFHVAGSHVVCWDGMKMLVFSLRNKVIWISYCRKADLAQKGTRITFAVAERFDQEVTSSAGWISRAHTAVGCLEGQSPTFVMITRVPGVYYTCKHGHGRDKCNS